MSSVDACDCNEQMEAKNLSVKELKAFLNRRKVEYGDCLEKLDFISKVQTIIDREAQGPSSDEKSASSASGSAADIRTIPVGPLQCNMVLIVDKETLDACLVDPGGDADKILALIAETKANVKDIYITHGHFDHFLAAGAIKAVTGATIHLHDEDLPLYKNLPLQLMMVGMQRSGITHDNVQPDKSLVDGQQIAVVGGVCCVIHTPGHSPGSCCFYFPGLKLLCSGDTLFRGGVGRSDFPGGDSSTLLTSIKTKLYPLADETRVIPGHGSETTIGHEKKFNPFVRASM
jgi:hydroxyacylglutathione hydrolase